MIVIGITGSIGMGKSTAASMLERLGVPAHNADAAVHELLKPGGAGEGPVRAAFPQLGEGPIDRSELGAIVFSDDAARLKLESILHPLVRESHKIFIDEQKNLNKKIVALDIPLLFETGWEKDLDHTIVVTAPHAVQRARVLKRPGMDEARFQAILQRQLPDAEKRRRSDFVVQTGFGRTWMNIALKRILRDIRKKRIS